MLCMCLLTWWCDIDNLEMLWNCEKGVGPLCVKHRPSALCSVTLSVWLYLLSWCGQSVCGIIKHVNEHRSYGSPLIMLSDTGKPVRAHSILRHHWQNSSMFKLIVQPHLENSCCSKPAWFSDKIVSYLLKYIFPYAHVSMSWSSGNIVVQVQMVNGEERAFTAHAALPLHTWIRLDIFFQVSEVHHLYSYAVTWTFLK